MLIPFASIGLDPGGHAILSTVLGYRCRPSRIVVAPSDAWSGLVVTDVRWKKYPVFPETRTEAVKWPSMAEVPFEVFTSGYMGLDLDLNLPVLEAGSVVAVHVVNRHGSAQEVRLCMEGVAEK